MSVYKRGGVWWYAFYYQAQRYRGSTGQLTRQDAELVERDAKLKARQAAHGLALGGPPATPKFQEWAAHYYDNAVKRGLHAGRVRDLVRVALRFWGTAPAEVKDREAGAPYHDLTLGDVVTDPSWILKWETWLEQPKRVSGRSKAKTPVARFRPWSGQTKNQYRSLLSQMFRLAMSPLWRSQTGITSNPFAGGWRDPREGRTASLEIEDILAILEVASYHLRLALALALLTPKLREGNILRLRWRDFAPDLSRLTVHEHKTRRHTKRPLVAYVPDQLRVILEDAKVRAGTCESVITYQGDSLKGLRGAMRGAIERAAATRPHLVYGRAAADGITFHTLRHTAATLLADLEVPLEKRMNMMGQLQASTTMLYTHLRPRHELPVAERLSAALPIQDLVMRARKRPPQKTVARRADPDAETRGNSRERSDAPAVDQSS